MLHKVGQPAAAVNPESAHAPVNSALTSAGIHIHKRGQQVEHCILPIGQPRGCRTFDFRQFAHCHPSVLPLAACIAGLAPRPRRCQKNSSIK
jgi:hypothetical protein